KEDILSYLDRVGDANLLQEKGRNVFDVATSSFSDVRKSSGQLMDEGLIESVWTPQGIHWAPKDHVPNYVSVYAQRSRLKPPEEKVLSLLKEKPLTHKELLRKTKREKDALNESLRKLERSYLVARRGVEETVFVAREPTRGAFEEALDKILTKRLDMDGPYGATELAVALGLEGELVEEVLRDLESEGVVSSGHFLVDKEFQFMLTRDLQRLQRKDETREVFEEAQLKAFLLAKQFRSIETVDDFFDTFLEAGMVLDIRNHPSRFDYGEWMRRRASGDVLEGRFLNGRVRYVRAADVPLFLSAFPRSPLTELESKVLEVIRGSDGIDIWGISSKVRQEKEQVKEALDKLDYDVYVIRKFQGDGWQARNLYVAFDPPAKPTKDAFETLVKRFLAAYGPVPFSGIREWARFEWDELERLMDRLEEQGVVSRILVTGKAESEMFVLATDLPALRKTSVKDAADPVRVLSLLDPWAQPLWAQVASRYGEGWFFPLVKDGDLVGMAEVWEMSGCIEVRELDLASPNLLPEAIEALKRMISFYALRRTAPGEGLSPPRAAAPEWPPLQGARDPRILDVLLRGRSRLVQGREGDATHEGHESGLQVDRGGGTDLPSTPAHLVRPEPARDRGRPPRSLRRPSCDAGRGQPVSARPRSEDRPRRGPSGGPAADHPEPRRDLGGGPRSVHAPRVQHG